MSVSHISIDITKAHGQALRNGLDALEQALFILNDEVAAMPFMVDKADYSYLEEQFGLPIGKGAPAKAELESLLGKFNTNASVDNVKAATQQVLNYFA